MSPLRQSLIQQNHLLLALVLCAFVIISLFNYRFNIIADISHNKRNGLHQDTQKLIDLLKEDLLITAFVEKKSDKKKVKKYFTPLSNYKKNIYITFINPVDNPKTARELDYNPDYPLRMTYQDKKVQLNNTIKPAVLHNALQKLLNKNNILVAFSSGFGERQPYNDASFNYSQITQHLNENNFSVIETDLKKLSNVPENAALLVLAAPVDKLDSQTSDKITRYIKQGGNILWLADTDSQVLPETISSLLGIRLLDGVIVDANSQKYIDNKPDFVPVEAYAQDSFLGDMQTVSLFPQVRGLDITDNNDSLFTQQKILQSSASSWTETSMIRGNIAYDENTTERAGPITLGAVFRRAQDKQQEQRIIFLGDADFMANAYLHNADNTNLALRLFRWLSYQQELSTINTVFAADKELTISNNDFFVISFFYIILLPTLFLAMCLWLWYNRKNK